MRIESVDVVATKGRDFDAVVHLGWIGPRFGKLTGHACYSDDRFVDAPNEHQAHLQEELDL